MRGSFFVAAATALTLVVGGVGASGVSAEPSAVLPITTSVAGESALTGSTRANPAPDGPLITIVTASASTAVVTTTKAKASLKLPGWLHTSGSTIRTSKNKKYVIKAVAWFGMETSNCAPHGLWTIRLQNGLAQIKSMGFNTIRLPFSNECIAAKTTNSINYDKNPSLEGKSPLKVMDFFIAKAKAAGLNVILDRHRPGSDAQSELWYTAKYSEKKWISDWKALAKRYKKQSAVIGFDLHNEPHGSACWGCGKKSVDWRAAAIRAGNAVLKTNPKLLIIVEGVENQGSSSTWWGGGLAGAKSKPVTLKVKHRVVYSPHEYPSSIYPQKWFAASNYPKNLPSVWDRNWGYLDKKNIAPVLVGEFGTKLETSSDKQWLKKLVTYLKSNQISFAYWSFNPNSGDTGGLVKDDWKTRQKSKLAYLKPLLGSGTKLVTPAPDPKPSPAPTPAPTPTTPTTPTTPNVPGAAASGTWKLQSSWNTGYVANITVATKTGTAGWKVSWPDTHATRIASAWGMTCSIKKGVSITCASASYASAIPAGGSVEVGVSVDSTTAPARPALKVTAH